MKTISINLYKFEELSNEAKELAIKNNRDINTDYDWYENVYYDAKQIGIKILSFDLDRNKHAKIKVSNIYDTAKAIIKNHGETCETYKISINFLKDISILENNIDNTVDNDDVFDDVETDYLKDLSNCYADILQNEYEYLTSDEAIQESLITNEYDFFTEDGENY